MFKKLLQIIGPGFITASVVLGPGSIASASDVGARFGTDLLWLLVLAIVCMAAYVSMAARLGCCLEKPLLRVVAERYGAWLSIVLGISSFLVVAAFQFGNNLGVSTALSELTGLPEILWPLLFTVAAIVFLFWAKNVYALVEKIMAVLVAVMILAFFANLFFSGIEPAHLVKGLVPKRPEGGFSSSKALVATSFSVIAALYQAYLVRSKGWKIDDYPSVIRDAYSGIVIVGLVTGVILITSAEAFAGKGITIKTAGDLAIQLEALFGPAAHLIFCIGLAAAAFSSFIVNALLGGGLLCDGLGWDASMNSRSAKIAASAALLIGMTIAVAILHLGFNAVRAIVFGQMSTLLAVPIAAVVLFWMANQREFLGDHKNGIIANLIAAAGLILIVFLWYETAGGLLARFG